MSSMFDNDRAILYKVSVTGGQLNRELTDPVTAVGQ